MRLRRVISKRIERQGDGFNVHAALDAVIAANVNERSGDASASSEQHVVQRAQRSPDDEQEATDE